MRLGLDFDGTIQDASSAKQRYARDHFGLDLGAAQVMRREATTILSVEQYERMIRDVQASPLVLEVPPMPGAIEVMQRLEAEHELYIVTGRYDYEADWAQQWLGQHAIEARALEFTSRGPKIEACSRLGLDLLLDDWPPELELLAELTSLHPVLFEAPYNLDAPRAAQWHSVGNWQEFEELVARLERGELSRKREALEAD